jgi:hypothetical protein
MVAGTLAGGSAAVRRYYVITKSLNEVLTSTHSLVWCVRSLALSLFPMSMNQHQYLGHISVRNLNDLGPIAWKLGPYLDSCLDWNSDIFGSCHGLTRTMLVSPKANFSFSHLVTMFNQITKQINNNK